MTTVQISYNDLSFDKQQEILNDVKYDFREELKKEAEEKRELYVEETAGNDEITINAVWQTIANHFYNFVNRSEYGDPKAFKDALDYEIDQHVEQLAEAKISNSWGTVEVKI